MHSNTSYVLPCLQDTGNTIDNRTVHIPTYTPTSNRHVFVPAAEKTEAQCSGTVRVGAASSGVAPQHMSAIPDVSVGNDAKGDIPVLQAFYESYFF